MFGRFNPIETKGIALLTESSVSRCIPEASRLLL